MSKPFGYVAKRLLFALLTLFLLITLTFFLMHLLPGDPFTGNAVIRPEIMDALQEKYGFHLSKIEQYFIYLKTVLGGDLGTSLISRRPVTEIIATAFPVSFELGMYALCFALPMGILLGALAATKKGTPWDSLTMIIALVGVSLPSFILGALLQYFLGLVLFQATGLRLFSVMGWGDISTKILPSFALALGSLAVISRLMRSSMLEVLSMDYIRTAKAKGLTPLQIFLHHGLRNAFLPVLSVLGPLCATLLTGTFVIENIFAIPGLGRFFVDSIQSNDYPVIMGTTLFFGGFLVVANLLVDLLHALLDPQVRFTKGGDL